MSYKRRVAALGISAMMGLPWVFASELNPTKVLLVLAHPDDETMIGPLLIKFKEAGIKVAAFYATKGEGGMKVIEFSNGNALKKITLPQNEMASIRLEELSQASKRFGFMSVKDLGVADNPMRDSETHRPSHDIDKFLKSGIWDLNYVKRAIQDFAKFSNPDVVITMGLDENNHIHHKAVRILTEVLFTKHLLGESAHSLYAIEETDHAQGGRLEPRNHEFRFDARQISKTGQTFATVSVEISKYYKSQEVSFEPDTVSSAALYLVRGIPSSISKF